MRGNPLNDIILSVKRQTDILARRGDTRLPLLGDEPEFSDGEYRFTESLRTLLFECRIISDAVQLDPGPCQLYAGFQKLSYFLEHGIRYKKLTHYATEVYVIGVPDVEVKSWAPNVHIVTRHTELIERHWFEIVYGRTIHISLLAEEIPSPSGKSSYMGFYTTSRLMTEKILRRLARLGIVGDPVLFE